MSNTEKTLLVVLQSVIDHARDEQWPEFQNLCCLLIQLGRTMELEAKGWPPMPEIKPLEVKP